MTIDDPRTTPDADAGAGASLARLGLPAFFIAEVVALTLLQAPNEMFFRYAFGDSGASLTIHDLIRRGYRPTIDFGYIYGLLPLLINRVWFAATGATTGACWWATLACNIAMAWGLARFASAWRVGRSGLALLALAMPDLLRSSYDVLVQVLEPALLVHALAEQSRGRRGRALALVTAAAFVKPSMSYVFGLYLLAAIALTIDRRDPAAWRRALGPAFLTGATLAVLLASVYDVRPLVNSLIPTGGMEVYRQGGLGFFRGTGRAFWDRPGAGLRGYFRYEIGYWLAGTFVLIAGGLESLVRLSRRAASDRNPEDARHDEVVLGCAVLHVAFVTLFFGHNFSWKYYLSIFLLGLAALSTRGRRYAWAIGGLAMLVLVSDRAWVQGLEHDWSTRAPSTTTAGLWATSQDRDEWARVLALTRGRRPVLLADCEGATLLFPQFAPPMGAYFVPGHPLPVEVRRKAAQLADAAMIVKVGPPGDRRFDRWPALADALDGCTPVWEGDLYQVYRRDRPPAPDADGPAPRPRRQASPRRATAPTVRTHRLEGSGAASVSDAVWPEAGVPPEFDVEEELTASGAWRTWAAAWVELALGTSMDGTRCRRAGAVAALLLPSRFVQCAKFDQLFRWTLVAVLCSHWVKSSQLFK